MSDKIYLILVRFLSIASFATSVFALFTAHHKITINEHPYVSHIFDIQCEDLPNGSEAQNYCQTSKMTRYYGLWRTFDSFFSLVDWDGGVLCGSRDFPVPVENNPDIAMMTVDNLGDCTDTTAMIATGLAIGMCVCASFNVIYVTVFSSMHDVVMSGGLLLIFAISLIGSSAASMILYTGSIDPLRLDPTFCEKQTLFSYCEQDMGDGFWFLIATLAMACILLVITFVWKVMGLGSESAAANSKPPQKQNNNNNNNNNNDHHQEHPPFYASLHFYVMLVKFGELAVLTFGLVSPFAKITTTIPPMMANNVTAADDGSVLGHAFAGAGGQMETEITLWQGLWCQPFGARLFLWSVVLDEDGRLGGNSTSTTGDSGEGPETFGQCYDGDIFESRFGYTMALFTAITSMTLTRDAKTMPLAYLVGFVMHFLSLVKLSIAIGKFMFDVYPGRKEIDPSYCSLWTSYVGQDATCSIEVGDGVILTAAAFVSVLISFIGEVVIQRSEEFGVASAYHSLMGRVRQGRIKDLVKPQSTRQLDVDDGGESPNGDIIENFTDENGIVVYKEPQPEEEEEDLSPATSPWVIMVGLMSVILITLIMVVSMTVIVSLVWHREERS